MSNQAIAQNAAFTITGDSIIEDTVAAWVDRSGNITSNMTMARLDSLYGRVDSPVIKFVQGKPWQMSKKRPALMPDFSSGQALIDALYNMSIDKIAAGIDKNGYFASQHNLSRLYCSIYMSLACLKPHQAMETLRSLVDKDSLIMQRDGQWPVVSDHIGWATAAWEVYCVTGDHKWLEYSYHAIKKTLEINRQVLLDPVIGLIHGAGYSSSAPIGERRMTWMGYNDLYSCMSLGNNILTCHAYTIIGNMADELDIDNIHDKDARHMKDAINQHLWNELHGFYSSFLYGIAVPRQSPLTDNTSQAMCVLWGIADDDRAENLVEQTPVSEYGVNVTYPPSTGIEPYFVNSSWATTQAMWNLAAAYTGNENALRRGLGALYRAQALYQSRDLHIEGINTDHLGTAAANAAMVIRVLLGMTFTPQGIEFAPTVPKGMSGNLTLKGLHYRRAVVDVTVNGVGNDVASVTLGGKPLEGAFLPGDVEGHQHIVITLKNSPYRSNKVTLHHNEAVLPPTPTVEWRGDSGHIIGFRHDMTYRLNVNEQVRAIDDSVFALPITDAFAEYSVEIAGRYIHGFMSRPYLDFGITPQTAFFTGHDGERDSITVSVAWGGDYLLDVGYYPTGTLDVRRVAANTHPMGTLVMTRVKDVNSNELIYSNMLNVKLLKGDNLITFTPIRLPKPFTPCRPSHVRVVKRQ